MTIRKIDPTEIVSCQGLSLSCLLVAGGLLLARMCAFARGAALVSSLRALRPCLVLSVLSLVSLFPELKQERFKNKTKKAAR